MNNRKDDGRSPGEGPSAGTLDEHVIDELVRELFSKDLDFRKFARLCYEAGRSGVAGADTPTGPPLFDKPPRCTCGHKARSHGPNWNGESPEKEATGFAVCHYPGCPCLSYCRPLPVDSVLPATAKEKE